jgi:hypothetical protein
MIILYLFHFIACLGNLDGISGVQYYEQYFSQFEPPYYDFEILNLSEKTWRKKNEIIKNNSFLEFRT